MEKVAIVTGSAKGLGREIAIRLAEKGYVIILNFLNSKTDAIKTLNKIRQIQPKSICVKADVTKKNQVNKIFLKAKKIGKIEVVVNNVGDFLYKPILKCTSKELERVISNNILSCFLMSKQAIKEMKKGCIVNIGSVGCDTLIAPVNTTGYYIGKSGVIILTKALSRQKKGVRVNSICPGMLRTSVVISKGAKFTELSEISEEVIKFAKGKMNGKIITKARWRPEG